MSPTVKKMIMNQTENVPVDYNLSQVIGELKDVLQTVSVEMSANRKSIEKLTQKFDAEPRTPSIISSLHVPSPQVQPVPSQSGLKRRAVEALRTPLRERQYDPPICGIKETDSSSNINIVAPKFWIHLSRFEVSMTETRICEIVAENLGINDSLSIKAVKLLPKNINFNSLEFVTFKVGIDECFKNVALDPISWPKGIFIRPFKDFGNFRQPTFHSSYQRTQSNIMQSTSSPTLITFPVNQEQSQQPSTSIQKTM